MTCCDKSISKSTYHCAACCNTFGSLESFDNHQERRGRSVRCKYLFPGLVQDRWDVWRTPEDKESVEAKVDAMATARAEKALRAGLR